MAEVYDQYLDNGAAIEPAPERRWMSAEDRLNIALNQTELLKEVRRRVTAFIEYYEEDTAGTMQFVRQQREKGTEMSLRTAALAEQDIQALASGPRTKDGQVKLTLDDLRILLDQFPQQDF